MSTLPFNPDPYNMPVVDVSPLSVKSYFPKLTVPIGTWAELWFGPKSNHLDIGYSSDDPVAVADEVTKVLTRGFDFIALDWYGPDVQPQHASALLFKAECEKQGLGFVIVIDKGAFQFGMPKTTMDATTYGLSMMKFVADNFMTSKAYYKHTDGRRLLFNWDCASVTGLDCLKVFSSVPNVAVIYEHSGGVSKPASAGCFGWVGLPDPAVYHANFLASVLKSKKANPKEVDVATLVKGFDDSWRVAGKDPNLSCWPPHGPRRVVPEMQGQFFLDRVNFLNQFMQTNPGIITAILVATHNDIEEDTTISDFGLDSQLKVVLSVLNGVLTVTLDGNLNTVDHVEIHINGQVIGPVAPTAAPITYDLTSLVQPDLGSTNFFCRAVAVGRPLFQIKTSATVSTAGTRIPGQTIPVDVNVFVDNVVVQLDDTNNGITITGNLTWPINKVFTKTVDAVVNTQIRWS